LHSTETLEQIAAGCGINARDISKMREIEGWPSRYERIHRVPRSGDALKQAQALALSRDGAAPPGESSDIAGERPADADAPVPHDGAEETPPAQSMEAMIARIERLIAQELAVEERVRDALEAAPRSRRSLRRCAQTLSNLAQTLATLARLRGAIVPQQGPKDDHDMPADIDEFRRALARRIVAFLESREADRDA